MSSTRPSTRGHWVFEFLNRRIGVVTGLIVLVAVGLAVAAPSIANVYGLLIITPSRKGEERERLLELHPSPLPSMTPTRGKRHAGGNMPGRTASDETRATTRTATDAGPDRRIVEEG